MSPRRQLRLAALVIALVTLALAASAVAAPPAPVVTFTQTPTDPSNQTVANFAYAADQQNVSFACSLDGAEEQDCPFGYTSATLGEGQHTFSVTASDKFDQTGTATYSWSIDTTDPTVTITNGPPDPSNSKTATFEFSQDDQQASATCWIDDAEPAACSSPYTTSELDDGEHTFHVQVTDSAGNTGSDSYTWTIDATAPVVTIVPPTPADPTSDPTATFEFTVDDEDADVDCWLDGGGSAPCAAGVTYSDLADGGHTFLVQATDAAGNVGFDVYMWTVDTTGPLTTITSSPPPTTPVQSASFEFGSDDPAAGFECALDEGEFAACESPQSYEDLPYGSHTFKIRATDQLGNLGDVASYTWTIAAIVVTQNPPQAQPPLTIDRTPPDSADPVDYFVAYRLLELTWARPRDSDFDHVTVFQTTVGSGARVAVYSGGATRFRDTRFNNGLDYTYDVISYDHAGNTSPAASVDVSSSALLGSPRRGARIRRPPTLSWAPVSGARFYNVQLFRNGRKIMSTWPRRPRVRLAARWHYQKHGYRLARGRYDWFVWPAFRSGRAVRYGPALGHSSFVRR